MQTMAAENLSINSVKARNKKPALEKIVADVAINVTKANAQLKERHVQNAISSIILPSFACQKTHIRISELSRLKNHPS